jgi:hypothetical protein
MIKNVISAVCIAAVAMLLGIGLLTGVNSAPNPVPEKPAFIYKVDGQTVKEFLLSDGTRCVILRGDAIACNWRTPQ